jgi:predicted DNA-binding protein YlxM (UPF0122 family)
MKKRISDKIKNEVIELRKSGLSYAEIAKQTKISRTSVVKTIKESEEQALKDDSPLEAKVLKPCINQRLVMIYFNDDKTDFAKCVVKAQLNYPVGKTLLVKPIETTNERLYRLL